jgi:hypothetical protein
MVQSMNNKLVLSLVIFGVICLSQILSADAAHVFDVHRMVQYDKEGVQYGPQKTTLNLLAATLKASSESWSKLVIVTPIDQFDESTYQKLVDKKAGGLLLLLPEQNSSSAGSDSKWTAETERFLLQQTIPFPVYFAYRSEELNKLYQEIDKTSVSTDKDQKSSSSWTAVLDPKEYRLVVNLRESKLVSTSRDVFATNIQGWLAGVGSSSVNEDLKNAGSDEGDEEEAQLPEKEKEESSSPSKKSTKKKAKKSPKTESNKSINALLPTIALVARYDGVNTAPSLNSGADDNASGVVSVLELARLFSKLYASSEKNAGRYNLLFLLTAGDSVNYVGSKYWLDNTDDKILDNIEFVLSLDSLMGAKDGANLFVSRPPKQKHIIKLYNDFTETAKAQGIQFEVVQKKINNSQWDVNWQHERFSRHRVAAGTVSSHPAAVPITLRGGLFDTTRNANVDRLAKNIKFVAEALAKYIYGTDVQTNIFEGSLAVDTQFINAWLETLASYPRMFPFTEKNHTVIAGLERTLSQYTTDVSRQTFTLATSSDEIAFYDSTSGQMTAYKSKPFYFDMFISVGVLAYAAALYVLIRGFGGAMRDLLGLFGSGKVKKA